MRARLYTKKKVPVGLRFDPGWIIKVRTMAAEQGMTMTGLIELAVNGYMDYHNKERENGRGRQEDSLVLPG